MQLTGAENVFSTEIMFSIAVKDIISTNECTVVIQLELNCTIRLDLRFMRSVNEA